MPDIQVPLASCSSASPIALLHVLPDKHDLREEAVRLHERAAHLEALGSLLGLSIRSIHIREFTLELPGSKRMQEWLENVTAIGWLGHVLYNEDLESMWTRVQRHLHAVGYIGKIFEHPESVEESFSLERSFYRLERAGLPQADTLFRPLRFDPAAYGIDEVVVRLRELLEDTSFEQGRVFFRSFYGAHNLSSYMNSARSLDELIEGCTVLFEQLRERQKIGGIALRQWLPISRFVDDLLGDAYRKEYRVFVVDGTPVMWSWHGKEMHDVRFRKRIECGELIELTPSDARLSEMYGHACTAGQALRSRWVALDFAILEDETVSLIDANPGYCAD